MSKPITCPECNGAKTFEKSDGPCQCWVCNGSGEFPAPYDTYAPVDCSIVRWAWPTEARWAEMSPAARRAWAITLAHYDWTEPSLPRLVPE